METLTPEPVPEAGAPERAAEQPLPADFFVFPVSVSQRRFWVLNQFEPGNPAYNIAVRFRIRGALDAALLERSFNEIVRRHEILRTTIITQGEQPVQLIAPALALRVPVVDLRDLPPGRREEESERLTLEEAQKRFDLRVAPLIRVTLLWLAAEEHVLLITIHHAISDGWSIGVITNELGAIYEAFARGQAAPLPELPIQYADFSQWQKEWLEQSPLHKELSYWKEQLQDLPEVNILADFPRTAVQTHDGHIVSQLLPHTLTDALHELGNREGATLFMTMLAAFQVLLRNYTGQDDIVVGSPIVGRTRLELEPLIGAFINTLVLRTDLSGNPTFLELLRRVNETVSQAILHQDMPFEELVEVMGTKRDLSRNPLFQINFTYQRDFIKPLHFSGLELTAIPSKSPGAILDLHFFLVERADGWRASCEYNTNLYRESTVFQLLEHFRTLLESVAANPGRRISELTMLSPAERRLLLVDWNQSQREFPRDRCVHELFEEQAARTPNSPALSFEGRTMTYRELNERANQLAHHLRGCGVRPNSLVGISLERSLEMIIGILGILKAGGAYVPLDPAYPEERLRFMLEDAKAPVLLTQGKLAARLAGSAARVLCLDTGWETIAAEKKENPSPAARPEHLIYVIYTSGSTGKPKATGVWHRGFTNLVHWYVTDYEISPLDRVFMIGSLSFDLTQKGIFGPLIRGGRLHVLPSGPYDSSLIGRIVEEQRITLINCTPSAFYPLVDPPVSQALNKVASLRCVTVGGEPISLSRLKPWLDSPTCRAEVANNYGPTECTDISGAYRFNRTTMDRYPFVPLGKPIFNAQLVVVNRDLQPCPVGVPGELCIAGEGVGPGYLNQPELTAAKFIPNPFPELKGARIYRTGDLCRYLPDGNIEFLGRIDHQVKIRGFRIELEEIESVLRQNPAISEAVVMARDQASGEKVLVAYLVGRSVVAPKIEEVRLQLKARMPDYMVPAVFHVMQALPLTPSGKVDKKALPEPGEVPPRQEQTYVAPRTLVEELLAAVWGELLRVRRVSIHDNFFELGGNSLLSMQVIERINKAGLHCTPAQLFQHQTVAELAAHVKTHQAVTTDEKKWSSLVALQPNGTKPPLFLVHTLPGDVLGYMELVRNLGYDQPCYGFQSHGLNHKEDSHRTFAEMSAHYVKLLREFQPVGPYYLGGWCFGGNVAYEMAQQLIAEGQEVALLALFETWAYPPSFWHLGFHLHYAASILKLGPGGILNRIKNKLFGLVSYGITSVAKSDEFAFGTVNSGPFKNREEVYRINMAAMKRYKSRAYPGTVTLFNGTHTTDEDEIPLQSRFATLAREMEVHVIPGSHRSVLKEPAVRMLAERLNDCLARAHARSSAAR